MLILLWFCQVGLDSSDPLFFLTRDILAMWFVCMKASRDYIDLSKLPLCRLIQMREFGYEKAGRCFFPVQCTVNLTLCGLQLESKISFVLHTISCTKDVLHTILFWCVDTICCRLPKKRETHALALFSQVNILLVKWCSRLGNAWSGGGSPLVCIYSSLFCATV